MSDWRATELFIARSQSQHGAYKVGIALAALGNRKQAGWTHASLDRIALLARLTRSNAFRAIHEQVDLGELEYEPGTSRFNRSRYRIREEVLRQAVDRFRYALTIAETDKVTSAETATVTIAENGLDHHRNSNATIAETAAVSVKNRSLDQISNQLPSDQNGDPTKSWTRTEEHDGALKASLEACRRAVETSAGESSD